MSQRDVDGSSALEDARELELAALVEAFEEARRGDRRANSVEVWIERHPEFAAELSELLPGLVLMESMGSESSEAAARRSELEACPETIGAYRIIRRVGRGGMGIVYLAEQPGLDRAVALKVLPANVDVDRGFRARFQREAKAAAQLQHPHIVPVFEAGHADGRHFFAMRFVDGLSLDERLRAMRGAAQAAGAEQLAQVKRDGTRLTASEAAKVAAAVASALEHAHQRGVLHRDIKPGNILLDESGHPWVTDFGLCRMEDAGNLTSDGAILGTLRYMAPEQMEGSADERSDVYGVGLLLFELLTLRPAFDSVKRTKVIHDVLHTPVPKLRKLRPDAPRALEIIVQKATAKLPEERYGSAAAFLRDLTAFAEDRPISAQPPSAFYLARLFVSRHLLASVVSAVAVCLLGLLAGLYVRDLRASEALSARRAYVGDLAAAEAALREGAIQRARFHLDQAPAELRSWEWRHLNARIDQSLAAVALGSDNKQFALSPDGKRAAVCNSFGLHVVSIPSMEVEATVRCSYARAVAWDGTGERLVIGLWAGELRCYHATGPGAWEEPIIAKVPQDIAREPASLLWSGEEVIVGTRRGNVYSWRPGAGEESAELRQFAVLADVVVGIANAPSVGPEAFYVASSAGEILVHDGDSVVERFTMEGVVGNISSIALRDDLSSGIYSSDSADHAVVFSDRGRLSTVVREGTAPLRGVDLDGDLGAVVGDDKLVHLVDMRAPMVIRSLSGSPHLFECVKMVPGTRWILTLGHDGRLRLWDRDLAGGGISLTGHVNDVNAVAFDVDGRRLATGGRDGVVILWDAVRAEALRVFTEPWGLVIGVAFLGGQEEGVLLASTQAGSLYGWDLDGEEEAPVPNTRALADHLVQDMIRDPLTGDALLATSRGLLRVDETLQTPPVSGATGAPADGTRAWCTAATEHWLRGVDVVEDRVVSLSDAGVVLVHDLASGEEQLVVATGQRVITTDISAMRVEAEVRGRRGRRLGLFVTARQEIMAVDIDSAEVIELVSTSEDDRQLIEFPMYAEWIEEGRRFLVSSRNGLLSVWSTAPLEHLVDLRGHERWAMRIEESPRGDAVASLASFGGLRLWNTLSTGAWAASTADVAPLPASQLQASSTLRASAAGQTRSTLVQALGGRLGRTDGRLAPQDWYLVASLYRMRREPASRALYAIAESRNVRSLETLAQLENAELLLPEAHGLRPLLERALAHFFSVRTWRDARFAADEDVIEGMNDAPPAPLQCTVRSAVALLPFVAVPAAAMLGPMGVDAAGLVLGARR